MLADDTVYQGHFSMRKLKLQHRLFAGGWSAPLTRELFDRGDAIAVLPYDPISDSLIFIEQFRPGANARVLPDSTQCAYHLLG